MAGLGIQEGSGLIGQLDGVESQSDPDTGVLETDGQNAPVDLVELHQLQKVYEECHAVVHGVVTPAAVFTL